MSSHAVWRIVDANYNRASEGLRVLEEFARFVLEDRFLTSQFKQLRHDLAAAIQAFSRPDLLAARDTQNDIGTVLRTDTEYHRPDLQSVLSANSARVEQSLRVLEEYAKTTGDPGVAAQFESLRYRAYTLHRALAIVENSQQRLLETRLYVLIDGRSSVDSFRELVRTLIDAGVHALQLRDKSLSDRQLWDRARILRELTRDTQTLFIVNDRPDLAVLANADGIHVGQDELRVQQVRQVVGPRMLVGVSTHSLEEAHAAVHEGANYIGCGPTFPSATKTFAVFPGVAFLQAVADEISLPAFAIGGIGEDNLATVLLTGIKRIAVGSAITQASDPAGVVRRMLERLS